MNKYEKIAKEILNNIGGDKNIEFATHCMTRLRINVKDKSKVNADRIKKIDGILGSQFSGDQFQVIIGQDVDNIYYEFSKLTDKVIADEQEKLSTVNGRYGENNRDRNFMENFSFKRILNKILDAVSGSVTPILPIITATGIIKLIYALLGSGMLNLASEKSDFMILMNLVGDAGFYFFPIFVAWSASKKFNTNTPIALFLGAILIHPMLLEIVNSGNTFTVYGIPMSLVNYSSQFLPSILIVWIMSFVYHFFDIYSPKSMKIILVPTLTLLVMLPIALSVLGPLGNYISLGLAHVFTYLFNLVGPVAIGLIAAVWFFLVATGMHQALIALAITAIGVNGSDNLILVGALIGTYSLMGITVSYLLRSNKENKAIASSNFITLVIGGISEPTIFSLLLQNKKAMFIQVVAGFIGGLIGGILNIKVYFFGATNILVGLSFGQDICLGIVTAVITFSIAALLGMVLGFDDEKLFKKETKIGSMKKKSSVVSPLQGQFIPLDEVKDPTFANRLMGDGAAIIPVVGEVYAPFDGEILALFPTGHAIGLRSEDGIEVLIHIGIDTVSNGGKAFHPLIEVGEKVTQGKLIMKFDFNDLKEQGYDLTTSIVIMSEESGFDTRKTKIVEVGDELTLRQSIS